MTPRLLARKALQRLTPALAALLCTIALAQGNAPAKPIALGEPAGPVQAGGPNWKSLTPAQHNALAPLEKEWNGIDAARKQKWLEIAARFPSLPPAEQARVQTRMTEWARLSPRERGEARLHYQEARQLSPAERQARWEQYKALPPDQRRQLAERAAPGAGVASAKAAPKQPHVAASAPTPKSNLVAPTPLGVTAAQAVGPTEIQAKPGATTTLISRQPNPPLHQQPGLPKIAAAPGFVDRKTLLPQRGAQAAATRSASAASAPPAHP